MLWLLGISPANLRTPHLSLSDQTNQKLQQLFFLEIFVITNIRPITPTADTIYGPHCNLEFSHSRWDLLVLTCDQSTSKRALEAYCVNLTHSSSLKFLWRSVSCCSAFTGYTTYWPRNHALKRHLEFHLQWTTCSTFLSDHLCYLEILTFDLLISKLICELELRLIRANNSSSRQFWAF